MALNAVTRARIIADLLKDGIVANEASYANADLATNAIAVKYGDAFWIVFPGTAADPANPTPAEKAANFIRRIRQHCQDVYEASRVPAVSQAATATEKATVAAEVLTDLGSG